MMRTYHSVSAAVVQRIAFFRHRILGRKKAHHTLSPARRNINRLAGRALCLVVLVSLVAAASPFGRRTIRELAHRSQGANSWTSSDSLPTRVFRSLAPGYGGYEKSRGSSEAGKHSKTEGSVNPPQTEGYAGGVGSIPAAPNMMPLPPDPPPTFTAPDPLVAGCCFIQAVHITELRDAVNLVRARAGLPPTVWDTAFPAAPGYAIKAAHILDLRTSLDQARQALGMPAATYSAPAPTITGPIRAAHVQELRDKVKETFTVASTSSTSAIARLDPLNQTGGGGENPLSRNYNWTVPLVGLPGRSGLDLGLSLSYNSLVWTRSGTTISFDDDHGFPSPGFRIGFPVIQSQYFNSQVGKSAFMLITPNGERVELRQVNATNIYEAADSSYLTLTVNTDNTLTVRTTDGTQLSYEWKVRDYQCTKIKDRNGNFISVTYLPGSDRIDTVVDTLSRTIKFNYDTGGYLSFITQIWNQGTANEHNHEWASFNYNPALPIQTIFPGLTNTGPQNGATQKVLIGVKLNNNSSRFDFAYTSWGQVWKISNYASDGDLLNYRGYDLPGSDLMATGAQSDCPRFTERHDWAANWNGDVDGAPVTAEEAVTLFAQPVNASLPDGSLQTVTKAKVTAPDGTYDQIYFAGTIEGAAGSAPAWQRGLPLLTDTFGRSNANSSIIKQRSSATTWTQTDTSVSFSVNPRVTETNVYDFSGSEIVQNRKRTRVTYQNVTLANGISCNLPQDVFEYQANAATVLRRTHTDYNLATIYTDRGIIGLVSEQSLYEGDVNVQPETLLSKVGFAYDQTSIQGNDVPVQHDTSYDSSFITGRANLTDIKRYDVSPGSTEFISSSMFYNAAGSVVKTVVANHETLFSYADQFSADGITLDAARPATLAYPTMVTDPQGYTRSSRYDYDFSAVTWTQTPQPNTISNLPGPQQITTYDSFGRVKRTTSLVNGAYTRYVYPSTQPGSQNRIDTYATIVDDATDQNGKEAHSFTIFDGRGAVIASALSHPGSSSGGFSGQRIVYDVMGRVFKRSNPTETHADGAPSQWDAVGDDQTVGWVYVQQTYDWKGRPLITTNPSITDDPNETTTKEASYAGCGCAGEQVVTLTDEGTLVDIDEGSGFNNVVKKRQQKIYSDVLGRTVKIETFNWGTGNFGTGGSVYSTTVNSYNGRDQVTTSRQYQGTGGDYHEASMTYDGYGRLKTKHVPEQKADTTLSGSTDHTTWEYNSDDTVQSVTDARGITTTFGYNDARGLLTSIHYPAAQALPTGIPATADVTYAYDAAGNRTLMSDTSGNVVNYHYDSLSRLESEARQFAGLPGTYTLAYQYNLGGQVKMVADQSPGTATSFSYENDNVGRLLSVDSTGLGATALLASHSKYRASGALTHQEYGNGTGMNIAYNNRGMITQYSLSGAKEINGAARAEGSDFKYHPNGQVKFVSDFYGRSVSSMSIHDKSYQYDHMGRLQVALSGIEANAFLNGTNPGLAFTTPPYMQKTTYDVWNNLVVRQGRYWGEDDGIGPETYDGQNRNISWSYDADGRLRSMNEPPYNEFPYAAPVHTYDAAGRHVKNKQTTSRERSDLPSHPVWTTVATIDALFDGDGQQVKRAQTDEVIDHWTTVELSYYLRSSVLGGQVISEYNAEGTLRKSYVYAGGVRITKTNAGLVWRFKNPLAGDGRDTDLQGKLVNAGYLDPAGVDVGATDPADTHGEGPPPQPLLGAGAYAAYLPRSLGGAGRCNLDDMEIGCGLAFTLLGGEAAVQCPNNECSRYNPDLNNGNGGREPFHAYADGNSGYFPADGKYLGDGYASSASAGSGGGELSGIIRLHHSPQNTVIPADLYNLITAALQTEPCRKLFAKEVDPTSLFEDLVRNNKYIIAPIPAPDPHYVTVAHTSPDRFGAIKFLGDHMRPVRISTVSDVTISINSQGPFGSGYHQRYGASDLVNRAITLIHELGHAANVLFGPMGKSPLTDHPSAILDNDSDGTPEGYARNELNSFTIYNECFGSAPGANSPLQSGGP